MRGSPIIRTLLIAIGLVLAAAGIHTLTGIAKAPSPAAPPPSTESAVTEVPFELTLSAPARDVVLESAGKSQSLGAGGFVLTGTLPVADDHPTVFLTIRWAETGDTPRFAKLRLEPPGLPTQTHTFDSIGDLEDVWEPHLH